MKKSSLRHGFFLLMLLAAILLVTGLSATAAVTQTRTEGIDAFPESYRPYLQALQESHPTWRFVAFDTGLTWDEVLDGETRVVSNNLVLLSTKTSWKSLAPGSFDWATNTFAKFDGEKYNAASREIIAHYMDPRNSLSDLRYVFQFEQLTFDPNTQTEAGVKQILKGTFMKDDTLLPGFASAEEEGAMTYAQAFMAIAAELNVSPYHLAARVRQEQGTGGKSSLISGTYPGYEGYYNYFNVSASGSTQTAIIENGLKRAQKEGWNTAYKSLLGGAALIANKYIAKGQDTLYLEKFDVAAEGGMYSHQYMQNLRAAYSESLSVYNSYNNMGMLDGAFTFVIPVYHNMPEEACPQPTADGNPNYKLQSLGISEGVLNPDYHRDTLTYTATVGNDVHTLTVNALPYAATSTVSGTGSIGLAVGENIITVTVTAERGDTCTYTLRVTRLSDGENIIAMGTTTTGVNLRAEPSTEAEILTTVPLGRTVSILSDEGEWCQVIYGQYTGYMSKQYIHIYVPAKGLTLDQETMSVTAGTPGRLTAITDPDPCDTIILWKTSDPSIVTVQNGVVTGHYTGTAIITAYTENGLNATCTVTVTEPLLFEGTVNVKSSSSLNVREKASTSSTALGKLKRGDRVSVVEVQETWLRIRWGDGIAWVMREYIVSDPVDASDLTLTPATGELAPGHTLTLIAGLIPFYSTETISWSSDNEAVATVKDGIVTAVNEGTATITVASSGGLTASCVITVDHAAESVALDKDQAALFAGQTATLIATMYPSDAMETMSWSSSDEAVVTVKDGVITAVDQGTATITVTTATGKTATCTVTVTRPPAESVTLNQSTLKLYPGSKATLIATMLPSNAADTLVWSSDNEAVATVKNGVVTAITDGTAVITVTASPSGLTASCTVTVAGPADAVTLDKETLHLYQNGSAQLVATMTPANTTDTISWSSSDEAVASVKDGLVSAVGEGTATITVTTSSGKTASCTVTVEFATITVTLDQTVLTLVKGDTAELTATLAPAGITDTLVWSTSDASILSVDNGKLTAVNKGTATITATTSSGKTATCTVTVVIPSTSVTLDKTALTLVKGDTATLTATVLPAEHTDSLTWRSDNEAVVTVENGKLTAVNPGTATVTVTTASGKTATCAVTVIIPADSVTLDKDTLTLNKGDTADLIATVLPQNHTDALTWSTSDAAVATVENGRVTATGRGTATITVTTASGKSATCTVAVKVPATGIALNKNDITLVLGDTAKLTATLTPADSTDSFTWSSTDESIFTVQDGKVSATGIGTATLTVSVKEGLQATCIVRVKSPVPDKVTSSAFTVQDAYIRKIPLGTTVSQLLAGLNEAQYCKIYSGDKEAAGTAVAATGMVVKLMDGSTVKASYTLVVTGDADGDGKVTVNDYVAIKGHILKKTSLSGAYAQAGDADGDGKITVNDYVEVKGHILKKSSITAR